MADLLDEVEVRETLKLERNYRLLGVRWWGGGAFIRENKKRREIKAKTRNRVSSGWVIYNRLFAYRGSFAVLSDEHEGCYVSNEFPTFVVKDEIESPAVVAKYIVHCLNSPYYLSMVDAQSTGSTKESRNRFNQKLFLDMKIEIPLQIGATEDMVVLLDRADTLRADQQILLERVKALRQGVAGLLPRPK